MQKIKKIKLILKALPKENHLLVDAKFVVAKLV